MRQLNTIDSAFIYMHQRGPGMSMAMLQVFAANGNEDPVERYKKIVVRLKKAIPEIPMLHQKIFRVPGDADKPYWVVEPNVDIDYHIRHLALPPPGGWDELTEVYGQILSLPMDLSMPLWRVYVIEGIALEGLPPNSYAIVTRMHHAGADGITATRVTNVIAGAPLDSSLKPDTSMVDDRSFYNIMVKSVVSNLNSSVKLGKEYFSNMTSIARWAYGGIWDKLSGNKDHKEQVPDTRFNKTLSPDRVYDSISFDRNEFKKIRDKLGSVTVTDACLAICGGALREYLIAKGELPEYPLRCMMPISVRTDQADGNQFSIAFVPLGTDVESPLERLRSIQEVTNASKQSTRAMGGERLNELTNLVPSSLLALAFRSIIRYNLISKLPPLANCVISSVAGSPKKITFGENEMVYMHGSPPLMDGLGLLLGILGYDKNIVIAMTSCKQMVPDKHFMMDCLQRAYNKLAEAAGTEAHKKARTTSKVKAAAKKRTPRKQGARNSARVSPKGAA